MESIVGNEKLRRDAYERAKRDWVALQAYELLRVDLDIPVAAQTIVGALPRLRPFRAEIARLPFTNLAELDKLEDYVLALTFVHARYALANQPPEDLASLAEAATSLRDRLTAQVRALSLRGLFDTGRLASLKGGHGCRNVALDLEALCGELRAEWGQIERHCGVAREELDAAAEMSVRLLRAIGSREQKHVASDNLVEEMMRAFTLVINVWSEARRIITYLRWHHGDADVIAPRLYAVGAFPKPANEAAGPGSADTVPDEGAPPATSSTEGEGK